MSNQVQVKSLDPIYAREKENLHIKQINAYHKGIKKEDVWYFFIASLTHLAFLYAYLSLICFL